MPKLKLQFDPTEKTYTFLQEFLTGHNVNVPTTAKKDWLVEETRKILELMAIADEEADKEPEVARSSRRRTSARLAAKKACTEEKAGDTAEKADSPPPRRRGRTSSTTSSTTSSSSSIKSPAATATQDTAKQAAKTEDVDDGANWSEGMGNGTLIVPFFLLVCPITAQWLAWVTSGEAKHLGVMANAGLSGLYTTCSTAGWKQCASTAWEGVKSTATFSYPAAQCLSFFFSLALLLDFLLPGPTKTGPVTRTGHIPYYKENGFKHCVVFTLVFLLASDFGPGKLYPLGIFYDVFPGAITILNVSGLLFAGFLMFKGLNFPSTQDAGSTGSLLVDFYWGTELYPKVFGVDVKRFINCRLSMTFWMLAGLSFTARSYQLHDKLDWGLFLGSVSQFLYLVKFFLWEVGYLNSIDIIVDRAGWEIQWGCLVWVPCVYTLHSRLLVQHPSGLSALAAWLIFGVGMLGVALNYWADVQRQVFRARKGQVKIFGKDPVYVTAHYTVLEDGEEKEKTSLLLASGFWGPARHFHYCFELTAAWSWCLLANPFINGALPLFYAIFLTILLLHRAKRDEAKCARKYGKDYEEKFCALVPYLVIPGIY